MQHVEELPKPSIVKLDSGSAIKLVKPVLDIAAKHLANSKEMFNSLLRWSQPSPELCKSAQTYTQCDFKFISHAVGTGIRYRTPIGPVRLDVGGIPCVMSMISSRRRLRISRVSITTSIT